MAVVNWSIATGDSGQPGRLTASSYTHLYRVAVHNPGSHPIIVMHDGKASAEPESKVSSFRGNTVRSLSAVIDWSKARGYVFTDPAGHRF